MTTLEVSIFGHDGRGGIAEKVDDLATKLDRIYVAVMTAAISFGVGSIGVVITLVLTRSSNH